MDGELDVFVSVTQICFLHYWLHLYFFLNQISQVIKKWNQIHLRSGRISMNSTKNLLDVEAPIWSPWTLLVIAMSRMFSCWSNIQLFVWLARWYVYLDNDLHNLSYCGNFNDNLWYFVEDCLWMVSLKNWFFRVSHLKIS
jgi:hypothetical protein